MRGRHPLALCVEQDTGQKAWLPVGCSRYSIEALACKQRLHFVPKSLVDKGLMLAEIALVLVHRLAPVGAVLQDEVERAPGERLLAIPAAVRSRAGLADDTKCVQVRLQQAQPVN
jgi:hypothetical protein